jgi:uncharacterized protein with HEPN domain
MLMDDELCLHHMREHAAKALALAVGKTRAEFDADEVLRLALTYLIQIVGEAASQISRERKTRTRKYHGRALSACGIGSSMVILPLTKISSGRR